MIDYILIALLILLSIGIFLYTKLTPTYETINFKKPSSSGYLPSTSWVTQPPDTGDIPQPCLYYDLSSSPRIREELGSTIYPICLRNNDFLYRGVTQKCVQNFPNTDGSTSYCKNYDGTTANVDDTRIAYIQCDGTDDGRTATLPCVGEVSTLKIINSNREYGCISSGGIVDITCQNKFFAGSLDGSNFRFQDTRSLKCLDKDLSLQTCERSIHGISVIPGMKSDGYVWYRVPSSFFGYDYTKITTPSGGQTTNSGGNQILYVGDIIPGETLMDAVIGHRVKYISFYQNTISMRDAAELLVPRGYETWSSYPTENLKQPYRSLINQLSSVNISYTVI